MREPRGAERVRIFTPVIVPVGVRTRVLVDDARRVNRSGFRVESEEHGGPAVERHESHAVRSREVHAQTLPPSHALGQHQFIPDVHDGVAFVVWSERVRVERAGLR